MVFFRGLQTELARDMGYAAARFGHVMFPENVYEPVLKCAELLLEGVGKGLYFFSFFFPIYVLEFFFFFLKLLLHVFLIEISRSLSLSHVIS